MALTAFGGVSKTIFINEIESHKLHLAFEVAAEQTIKRGQPAKLDADGNAVPMAGDGSDAHQLVGYSIHNGKAGSIITLGVVGFAVVFAMAKTALVPGPVMYVGQNATDTDYSDYEDTGATAATMNGIALDVASAPNAIIRVLLK